MVPESCFPPLLDWYVTLRDQVATWMWHCIIEDCVE